MAIAAPLHHKDNNLYFALKEASMAKHHSKAKGMVADAKESAMLRMLRIDGSQNGATLRTRIVRDKKKYNRNIKHRKSLASARDFAFMGKIFDFFSKVYKFCKHLFAKWSISLPTFELAGEYR